MVHELDLVVHGDDLVAHDQNLMVYGVDLVELIVVSMMLLAPLVPISKQQDPDDHLQCRLIDLLASEVEVSFF